MKYYISIILLTFSLFCVLLTPAISETFICNAAHGVDKSSLDYQYQAKQLTLEIQDQKISNATLIERTYLAGEINDEVKRTYSCDVKNIDTDSEIECWHDMIKDFPKASGAKKSTPKNFWYMYLRLKSFRGKDDPLSLIKTGEPVLVVGGVIKAAHTRKGLKDAGGHRRYLGSVICK